MKIMGTLAISALTATLLVGNAQAFSGFWKDRSVEEKREHLRQVFSKVDTSVGGEIGPVASNDVPELDGAGAGIALGLLGTLIAIRRERRKS